MQPQELPQTVRRVLGPEAAQDFMSWLEDRLSTVALPPSIQLSAFVARQKVNVFVLEQVSNLLLAGEPSLTQEKDGNWVWRVPVDLTLPSRGRVGRVGEVSVDAHLGQVHYDQALLDQMADEARRLMQQVRSQVK